MRAECNQGDRNDGFAELDGGVFDPDGGMGPVHGAEEECEDHDIEHGELEIAERAFDALAFGGDEDEIADGPDGEVCDGNDDGLDFQALLAEVELSNGDAEVAGVEDDGAHEDGGDLGSVGAGFFHGRDNGTGDQSHGDEDDGGDAAHLGEGEGALEDVDEEEGRDEEIDIEAGEGLHVERLIALNKGSDADEDEDGEEDMGDDEGELGKHERMGFGSWVLGSVRENQAEHGLLGNRLVAAGACCSGDLEEFVDLDAQAPVGVGEAVGEGGLGVGEGVWAVHGLEETVGEVPVFDGFGKEGGLGVDEFELIAGGGDGFAAGLGADADPVDGGRDGHGAVGFDGDVEADGVEGVDEWCVELEEGFAAGTDDHGEGGGMIGFLSGDLGAGGEALVLCALLPEGLDVEGERVGGGEFSAAGAVGADEVGIAELADGAVAVFLTAGPEVAAGEAAEDRGAASVGAFALEGVIGFFDEVGLQGVVSGKKNIGRLFVRKRV